MNKNTKITSAILALIIIVVIVLALKVGKKDGGVEGNLNATSTLASTSVLSTSTATSSIMQAPKPQILQDTPFVNQDAKFAVFLPKDWVVQDIATSSTVSNTWFYDSTLKGDAKVSYFVGRVARDEKMDLSVAMNGKNGFLDLIAKGMEEDLNQYILVSTSTVSIKGVNFQKYVSTYVGEKSGKKVNQYKYLSLTDKNYYVIGLDAYDEAWMKNRDKLTASVSTFELLP